MSVIVLSRRKFLRVKLFTATILFYSWRKTLQHYVFVLQCLLLKISQGTYKFMWKAVVCKGSKVRSTTKFYKDFHCGQGVSLINPLSVRLCLRNKAIFQFQTIFPLPISIASLLPRNLASVANFNFRFLLIYLLKIVLLS